MTTMVLLALMGQCVGGSCSAGSYAQPMFSYPAPIILGAEEPAIEMPVATRRHYDWYPIVEDGLHFKVWGYLDGGKCWWNRKLPENVESYRNALSAREQRSREEAVANRTAEQAPSPSAPPAQRVVMNNGQVAFNYGLDPDKLFTGKHEVRRASDAEAARFFEGANDNKMHLTVIGTEDQCKPVMNDLKNDPRLLAMADGLLIQEYRPGDWAIDPALGFNNKGAPTIMIQQRNGRVLARMEDYKGGSDSLVSALRKADPHYDPKKDPVPAPDGGPSLPLISKEHWLAVGLIALLLLTPKRSAR